VLLLLWMGWQIYRAKQFNRFKQFIRHDIKPQVVEHLKSNLVKNRNENFPNDECHIQASIDYWCVSTARMLQYALQYELVSEKWLKETGNYRHCQHLFHIEGQYLHTFIEQIEP